MKLTKMTRLEAISYFTKNPDKKLKMIKNCNGNKVDKIYFVDNDFVVDERGVNLGICVINDKTEFEEVEKALIKTT